MIKFRRTVACVLMSATALALLPLMASPAGAVSKPQVIATGLNDPYKLNFGPDGALYVAEAGTGGDECVEIDEGEDETFELCFGTTGSVTKIGANGQERVVQGLPSFAGPTGEEAGGATEAVWSGNTMYVVVGLGGPPEARGIFSNPAAAKAGTILKINADGTNSVFADLAAYEAANDPDAAQNEESPDTNPFGLEAVSDGFLAVDAGGNDLLHINNAGQISLRTVFPFEEQELPPFLGAPPGTKVLMQPVPTAVETDPDGDIHVAELTGFPFPPGEADVYQVEADGDIAGTIGGFTNVVDIAFAPDGTLYVLEFAAGGLLSGSGSQLVQVRTDGTRKVLLNENDLGGPAGGVTVDPDGMVYLTVCNVCAPGEGSVIKVDPTVAADAATADACPPAKVPGGGFSDIGLSVHRESIDCLKWWEIVGGISSSQFGPGLTISRAQSASLSANALEAAGVTLPANPADAFSDDDDSVHELRINQLAELGLVNGFADGTFRPAQPVTRAQVASFLTKAYETATGSALAAGPDKFTDDETSVHEANINAAAAAGWVAGRTATTFEPGGTAQRGQVASFAARWLSTLVDEGKATLPT